MSSNIVYTNLPSLLQSCTSIQARIDMLESILDGMSDAMLTATATGHFEEYKVDTGQNRVEIKYRSINELISAYDVLSRRLDREYSKLQDRSRGRIMRLVDSKNFR